MVISFAVTVAFHPTAIKEDSIKRGCRNDITSDFYANAGCMGEQQVKPATSPPALQDCICKKFYHKLYFRQCSAVRDFLPLKAFSGFYAFGSDIVNFILQ